MFNFFKSEPIDLTNSTIIDVRSPMEFSQGNVQNSRNIPVDQIHEHIDSLKTIPGKIVLCCASGARSAHATQILQRSGISNAINGGSWRNLL